MNTSRWLLAVLMLGGCAGAASSELGDRVARLEARVYGAPRPTTQPIAWEAGAAVGVSDAGTQRGPDAMPDRVRLPFRLTPKLKGRAGWDGGTWVLVGDGAAPRRMGLSCREHAERQCRWTVVQERSATGLTWKQRVELARAKDSFAGRRCLAKALNRCKQREQAEQREIKRFKKLDAELTPGNIDKSFTAQLKRALGVDAGASTVQVACTKHFCRIHGMWMRAFHRRAFADMGQGSQHAHFNGAIYATRDGYMLPE